MHVFAYLYMYGSSRKDTKLSFRAFEENNNSSVLFGCFPLFIGLVRKPLGIATPFLWIAKLIGLS